MLLFLLLVAFGFWTIKEEDLRLIPAPPAADPPPLALEDAIPSLLEKDTPALILPELLGVLTLSCDLDVDTAVATAAASSFRAGGGGFSLFGIREANAAPMSKMERFFFLTACFGCGGGGGWGEVVMKTTIDVIVFFYGTRCIVGLREMDIVLLTDRIMIDCWFLIDLDGFVCKRMDDESNKKNGFAAGVVIELNDCVLLCLVWWWLL